MKEKDKRSKTIMYKVVDSSYVINIIGSRFRLFSGDNNEIYLRFFHKGEKLPFHEVKLDPEEIADFFQKNNIKYEIDQEYGRDLIEHMKHRIEMIKLCYKIHDPQIIPSTILSTSHVSEGTYVFQMELD